ncbi:hypothetical protein EMCRGX_G003510 [Ephydatia muelleri]
MDAVLRHNALRDTLVHFLHRAHASVQVEVGAGLFPDHSQSRPADILLQNWNLGRPVALDISVVSPLNPSTLAEAGATFGAVLEATESRKHQANDEKCSALGWVSTPLAVDSYGAWGNLLKVNEGLSSIKIQFCKLGPKGLCEVCSAIGKKSTLESLTRHFELELINGLKFWRLGLFSSHSDFTGGAYIRSITYSRIQ